MLEMVLEMEPVVEILDDVGKTVVAELLGLDEADVLDEGDVLDEYIFDE